MKKTTLNTLKDYAQHRILDETINSIKIKYSETSEYFILVVDDESVKILSSICKMFDLISYKISTLEKLMLNRKRFASVNAIYIISPTKASVERLIKDFEEIERPQYNFAHVCFTSTLDEELMEMISKSAGLIPRIKTFCELNINFLLKENDLFEFGYTPNLSLYLPKKSTTWCEVFAEKLLTVCCTLNEYPYIQYYGNSYYCKEVAVSLNKMMSDFMSKTSKNFEPRDPRGTFIIVDRVYDLNAPLMHEYCYESIIYDVISISKEGVIDLDNMSRAWDEKIQIQPKNAMRIGELDPLWNTYRTMHIADVLKKLSEDIKELSKSRKEMDKKMDNLDKMQEIIAEMPNYKEALKSYQSHIKITDRCNECYKELDHSKLIVLEQRIITGIEDSGNEVDTKSIVNAVSRLSLDFPGMSDQVKFRIYLLYLANYNVPKRDAEFFANELKDPKYRDILLNKIQWLGQNWFGNDTSKPERRTSRLDRDDFHIYKKRVEQSKTSDIMYLPKIAKVAMQASQRSLSISEFPFVGDAPKDLGIRDPPKGAVTSIKKPRFGANIFSKDKNSEEKWLRPRIILFVIGGISHQEISTMLRMQKQGLINCPLTVGSEAIVTPASFIDSLKRIDEVHLDLD